MDTKAFVRAVLLVLCLVLAAPAVIWLVTATDLEVVAIAGLGLLAVVLLAYLAYVYRWRFWAWFMGGLAVLLTPGLLKLGAQFISGDFKGAMEAWVYVYAAGAVGGLVLELIRAKGGLEFPSFEPALAPQVGPPVATHVPSGTNGGEPSPGGPGVASPAAYTGTAAVASQGTAGMASPATALAVPPATAPFVADAPSQNGTDLAAESAAAPRGGRTDIGFFARVTMGGVAAAAVLILVRIIVGDTLPSDFLASALRLDTLAGAVLIGMIAPALWTGTQNLFESKSSFMRGVIDTATVAVGSAEQAVKSAQEMGPTGGPESSQFIVDAAPLRSPEFIATLAREEDPTELGKMLLTKINASRIDVSATQAQQEATLGQALGSLETAQRILRSAGERAARR